MANSFTERLKNGWQVFREKERQELQPADYGQPSFGHGRRPYVQRYGIMNKNNIVIPIYNRIGIDVASIDIRHVRLDENQRYLEDIKSHLNECLTLSANLDQVSRAFFQESVMTLCEEGVIAIVPAETTVNPLTTGGYDILSLRVGTIVEWYPQHVRVSVYNERTGRREELVLPKTFVAIVENPLYAVMNESNSLLQRLLRKLSLLDSVDEQASSGKLDLIIQLPYVIKSEARREEAERRRQMIADQLENSKYGIAYTDGTERITQLNRPAENNLLGQIEYLTNELYGQLGITPEILNGTADEATMINYHNRTIEPFLAAITMSMKRTFLTKTARSQGQSIEYYRDPFKLVPLSQIAEIADKFTRNEIASSNDLRTVIGWKPSDDPKANELRNANLSQPKDDTQKEEEEVVDAEVIDEETRAIESRR